MATAALFHRSAAAAAAVGPGGALQCGGGVTRRALASSASASGPQEQQQQQQQRGIGSSISSGVQKRRRPGQHQQHRRGLSTHAKRSSSSSFGEEEDEAEQRQGQYHRSSSSSSFSSPYPHVHVAPPSAAPMHEVVFVRHGQSTWNRANRFIGWCDTPLTEQGLEEARSAGQILRRHGVAVDEVHTSLLKRSVKTAYLILEELGMEHVPMRCHWRLNERSYGALVGKNKKECVAEHGAEQVKLWRRSFDVRPPPQDPSSRFYPGKDGRKYEALIAQGVAIPLCESLKDVRARAVQHWEEAVVPSIRAGKRVVVVGHENNLRGLLMHLEGISEARIPQLEIPRAVPLRYQFDAQMRPVRQPDAAPLLSGAFLMNQQEVEALQERDRRQVYDLSIRVNLEEADFRHVMSALSGSSTSSSSSVKSSTMATATATGGTGGKAAAAVVVSGGGVNGGSKPAAHRYHKPSTSTTTSSNAGVSSSSSSLAWAAFSTKAGAGGEEEAAAAAAGPVLATRLADAVRAAWGALAGGEKGRQQEEGDAKAA